MKKIVKYELKLDLKDVEMVRLRLPGHPTMLSVQVLDNRPYLYCLVAPGLPVLVHEFMVYREGTELKDACGEYVDSFVVVQKYMKETNVKPLKATENVVAHVFITGREVGRKGQE